MLACLFGHSCRRQVSQRVKRTKAALKRSIELFKYIGCNNMTRSDLMENHTSIFAREFYGKDPVTGEENVVVIADGK
jgi:hypothetical protein